MAETEQERTSVSAAGFEEFYREVEPRIRRALSALGHGRAQEATAAAMSYGFENWDRVSAMDNPVGYLYRVGRSSVRARRRPMSAVQPALAAENGFEPGLPHALNALSEPQRAAVLLVHAWGYSLSEASQILGVSISTVRHHLDKGLSRLRRTIGAETND